VVPLTKLDPFTQRRLIRFIGDFRARQGQLPTLKDLEANGFSAPLVDQAERSQVIEKFYVTLTNGSVVKGYKVKSTNVPF